MMLCDSRVVATTPESRKMPRCCDNADWLSGTRSIKLPDRQWPRDEIAQDHQALLVAERLEKLCRLGGVRSHLAARTGELR